ncbi:hypothetical protein C8R44DRAFT_747535 [Mycena epipterygia]|nr:hypothetical protein C8R44DRAFT_747535 [Mycena epipterygia]
MKNRQPDTGVVGDGRQSVRSGRSKLTAPSYMSLSLAWCGIPAMSTFSWVAQSDLETSQPEILDRPRITRPKERGSGTTSEWYPRRRRNRASQEQTSRKRAERGTAESVQNCYMNPTYENVENTFGGEETAVGEDLSNSSPVVFLSFADCHQ